MLVEGGDRSDDDIGVIDEELTTACVPRARLEEFDEIGAEVVVGLEQQGA